MTKHIFQMGWFNHQLVIDHVSVRPGMIHPPVVSNPSITRANAQPVVEDLPMEFPMWLMPARVPWDGFKKTRVVLPYLKLTFPHLEMEPAYMEPAYFQVLLLLVSGSFT